MNPPYPHTVRVCPPGGVGWVGAHHLELGHRGVLQPRWVQKMHRGGVDCEVEGGCAVEFTRISSTSDPPREV